MAVPVVEVVQTEAAEAKFIRDNDGLEMTDDRGTDSTMLLESHSKVDDWATSCDDMQRVQDSADHGRMPLRHCGICYCGV